MGIYIGIDPGRATGIAIWHNGAIVSQQERTIEQVYEFLRSGTKGEAEPVHIQCEWFTISARTIRTAVDYSALHLIGAIQYQAYVSGWTLAFTNPADVKGKFPDAALKQAGLWHKSDHVRDATRHLLVPLIAQGLFDPKALLL